MRLVILVLIILVCGWLGYETRGRSKDLSNILYGVSGLFLILFIVVLIVGGPD